MLFWANLGFAAVLLAFMVLRLRSYLHPFQQEEYNASRLATWWVEKRGWDRYATCGLFAATALSFIPHYRSAGPIAAAAWLAYRCLWEPNPTKATAKKPLVITARARHIWLVATLLVLPPLVANIWAAPHVFTLQAVMLIQTLPLTLGIANALLAPLQNIFNKKYLAECSSILSRLNPTIIGLTGSFGKTSTKYILGHVLSAYKPTLMTPGSTNTPLGIARIVREQLQPQHVFFLAEMGAYGPGSIATLCRLAPPNLSCITAVGEAHYERFKSLETVAEAKFEIAEATLKPGNQPGVCVLNIDGMPGNLWKPRVEGNPNGYRLVSQHAEDLRPVDYRVQKAEQTAKGLKLTIKHKGVSSSFQTPLFGHMQIGNLGTAFALAAELGMPAKAIAAAMAHVPAAPHRLNVKASGQGILIDDSYNSNPTGFAAALEVLSLIGKAENRRRVLVTPGMVELGSKHEEEHARLGALAAQYADVVVAIGPERIPSFIQAIEEAKSPTQLVQVGTLAQAQNWLKLEGHPTDVILIENDLPDRYESRWAL